MAVGACIVPALLALPDDAHTGVAAVAEPVYDVAACVLDAAPLVAVALFVFLRVRGGSLSVGGSDGMGAIGLGI